MSREAAAPFRFEPEAFRWRDAEGGRQGSHLLVAMHGYLSFEGDLISLAPDLPSNVTLVSVRAPIVMREPSRLLQGAYAWLQTGQQDTDPTLIDRSAAAVLEWLDSPEMQQDWASIGLLGFSQGAAMTLQLARHAPERFSYLLPLSGFVHAAPQPGDAALAAREPRIPALQAVGTRDDIIDPDATERTIAFTREHLNVEVHEYDMAHEVCEAERADIAAFVERHV